MKSTREFLKLSFTFLSKKQNLKESFPEKGVRIKY